MTRRIKNLKPLFVGYSRDADIYFCGNTGHVSAFFFGKIDSAVPGFNKTNENSLKIPLKAGKNVGEWFGVGTLCLTPSQVKYEGI
jgi:hypothetical protein